jgi:hypothetical protein
MRLGRRSRLVACLPIVLFCLVAGSIAYANIPDSGGTIHGCYKKTSPNQGTLRVIDTEKGQACTSAENALPWNQTGPQGATGLKGPTGSQGVAGTAAAFAGVSAGGTVNPATSENVSQASVSHPAVGLYCFGGLGFTPRSVVVTPISGIDPDGNPTSVDTIATAVVAFPPDTFPFGCAETDNVRVRTVAASAPGTLTNRPFMVWFED